MKNKVSKMVGVYALVFAVCTSSLVVFASTRHYRNEGEKPAPTYPLNANNETYGSSADAISKDTEPDLILVQLADGTLGYVRSEDLTGEVPNNPEEAVAMQIEKENRIQRARGLKTGRIINVYDENGEIVLGEFFISDGAIIKIEVDGLGIISDVAPQIKNNRTMVLLRIISENLGAKIDWSSGQVTLSKGDMQIILKAGSKEAIKNGQTELLDAITYINNDRVMVPLRFIAEKFGCEVDYKDRIVVITQKQINKEFKQVKANMAIITEDVTLQDPYVVTEDSNNKLVYQKINNDVFSLKRNDMVIVIEEYDTKYRIMQVFGDIPLVRGTIEKGKLSYDSSLFKDNGNQAIVNDAMSYDGINGNKKGVQYGVGKVLERKGEWAKISLPMEESDYWFKSDSLSYEFDTTVVDYVNKNEIEQFWDTLVEVTENNIGHGNEIYWRHIGDDIMQKVDVLTQKHGPEILFKGLESTNVYSQYYCINRLVEYYNYDDIRIRAIDEITPFLSSKNKTLKTGAQFAISVLDKKFDSPYIVSGIGDIKVFPLFNHYSDYGSYNELWMIKDDKLSKLHSFNGIQTYIDMEEPIKLSPENDKIAVQTSSRKSSSFNIIDLNTGKISPEIMRLAIEKVAMDHKDYNNTYPDGGYSWGHTLNWTSNDTVEFEARLAYNYMEIIEEVTVRYNFSNHSLGYTKH